MLAKLFPQIDGVAPAVFLAILVVMSVAVGLFALFVVDPAVPEPRTPLARDDLRPGLAPQGGQRLAEVGDHGTGPPGQDEVHRRLHLRTHRARPELARRRSVFASSAVIRSIASGRSGAEPA